MRVRNRRTRRQERRDRERWPSPATADLAAPVGPLPSIGHNDGPSLDEPALRTPRYCRFCLHWSPPPEQEERDYERFRLGLSRRRVRLPTGSCDRVLMRPGGPLSFSATSATYSCLNFSPAPEPPRPVGEGFVTIYEGDRIVWQGREGDLPADYRDEADPPADADGIRRP